MCRIAAAPRRIPICSAATRDDLDTITAIQPHVQSGGVRGLAVTTLNRSASQPNLPTIAIRAGRL